MSNLWKFKTLNTNLITGEMNFNVLLLNSSNIATQHKRACTFGKMFAEFASFLSKAMAT